MRHPTRPYSTLALVLVAGVACGDNSTRAEQPTTHIDQVSVALESETNDHDCAQDSAPAPLALELGSDFGLSAGAGFTVVVVNRRRIPGMGTLTIQSLSQSGRSMLTMPITLTGIDREGLTVTRLALAIAPGELDVSGALTLNVTVAFTDQVNGSSATVRRSYHHSGDQLVIYDHEVRRGRHAGVDALSG